jgi:Neocarzinostatin family
MMRRLILPAVAALVAAFGLSGCTVPAVTVTPSTDLVDGQQVTVRGSGYSPNSSLGVIQCKAPADGFDDCSGETARSFSANGSGGFELQYDVTRILEFGNGVEHDCAIPDSCFVVSVYVHGFQGRAAAPLQFRAEPAVSAWPDTNLTDGQDIQISGYGYAPNSSLGIVQCPTGATSIDRCDGRTADSFSADAAGNYVRRMVVYKQIQDAHGVVTDCSVADACVVASVYVHGFQGLATDGLHFLP